MIGILSRMYPHLFEKANKEKLVCDACELGKHIRSSYASSSRRSPGSFDVVHSNVWGPCPTTTVSVHTRAEWGSRTEEEAPP